MTPARIPPRITARRQDAIDRFKALASGLIPDLVEIDRTRFNRCCESLFGDSHMTTRSIEQVTEIIRIILDRPT